MRLENVMALAKKSYSKERYARLANIMALASQHAESWDRRLAKGEEGESVIARALREDDYHSYYFQRKREGKISIERKREKLKERRHPDYIAFYLGKGHPLFDLDVFYYDSKFKSLSKHLGVVNVVDYDGYWDFIRVLETPFKIFFYVKEVEAIWVHDLRDPLDNDLHDHIDYMRGTSVYHIPMDELGLYKRLK